MEKNKLIVYKDDQENEVELSSTIIRDLFCKKATDQEIMLFLKLCQHQRLNPFLKDAYLVKYGDNPAQMIVSYMVFSKRAQANERYSGFEMLIEGELQSKDADAINTLRATCKVFIKGYDRPIVVTAYFDEYKQFTYDKMGKKRLNSMWSTKPITMLQKVVYAQAHRLAFPSMVHGLYIQEELGEQPEITETNVDHSFRLPENKVPNMDIPDMPDMPIANADALSEKLNAEVKETDFDFGDKIKFLDLVSKFESATFSDCIKLSNQYIDVINLYTENQKGHLKAIINHKKGK